MREMRERRRQAREHHYLGQCAHDKQGRGVAFLEGKTVAQKEYRLNVVCVWGGGEAKIKLAKQAKTRAATKSNTHFQPLFMSCSGSLKQ